MKWEFNEKIQDGPSLIECPEFEMEEVLQSFQLENGKESVSITKKLQKEWLNELRDLLKSKDFGWQILLCGDNVEQLRLAAYSMISSALSRSKVRGRWVNVPSFRSATLNDIIDVSMPQILALDSVLIFPERVHIKDQRQEFPTYVHDFIRTANVYDICARSRGRHSTIVLAPGVSPDTACKMTYLKPDYMFYLKG